MVHHWSSQRADIRSFFKRHGLARPEIEVVLRERTKEVLTTQPGDSFLYGDQIATDFPLDLFQSKWANRFALRHDDWTAAPGTRSGFAWEGIEDNLIRWIALKAAWRQAAPLICQNCDTPTILIDFGQPWTGLLHPRRSSFMFAKHAADRSGKSR